MQVIAATFDKMLTPRQMIASGTPQGLPFAAHGGMWGDIILTAWLAYLTAQYAHEWTWYAVSLATVIGGAGSAAMHHLYRQGTVPEAHVRNHELTPAGYLHFLYMWGALAILVLFYLFTPGPSARLMWLTTWLLIAHVALGNHFVLGLIAPKWYPGRPLSSIQGWGAVLGTAILLASASYMRVGW